MNRFPRVTVLEQIAARTLQGVLKILQADARLTEDTLQRANNQIAMHRHRNAPISLSQANVRTGLSDNREAQSLQRSECLRSRDVPGQLHA
jgi:hypothetical protein